MYEFINDLCRNRGETITSMCKKAGVTRTVLSEFKAGRVQQLSVRTLQKIADFFGVSVDYISSCGKSQEPTEIDDFGFAMYNYGKKLTEEQKQILINLAKSMNTKE